MLKKEFFLTNKKRAKSAKKKKSQALKMLKTQSSWKVNSLTKRKNIPSLENPSNMSKRKASAPSTPRKGNKKMDLHESSDEGMFL